MSEAKIAMLNIGSELLRGRTINTNIAEAAKILASCGLYFGESIVVHDDRAAIVHALDLLLSRNDAVIITGGLGPTRDDLTKKVLGEHLGSRQMILHQPTVEMLEAWMKIRNRSLTEKMREQALVPDNCKVLPNKVGTAPGMMFRKESKFIFSLPGVPDEMQWLMKNEVAPILSGAFRMQPVEMRVLRTFNLPESDIARRVDELGDEIPSCVQIAYLPHDGEVTIELRAENQYKNELEHTWQLFRTEFAKHIVGLADEPIEVLLGKWLRQNKLTISFAESCTGGAASALLTSVSGSSDYFAGSVITYSEAAKMQELGIAESLIREHTVVSEPVVLKMAEAVRIKFGTSLGVAITGAAEARPGDPVYAIPCIWFAVSSARETKAFSFFFPQNRKSNIRRAAKTALFLALSHSGGMNVG